MNEFFNFLSEASAINRDKPLIGLEDGREFSYQEFYGEVSNELERWKKRIPDSGKFVFSIVAPNSVAYLTHLFALLEVGGIASNLNPRMTTSELIKRLNFVHVELLICTTAVWDKLKAHYQLTAVSMVYLLDDAENELQILDNKKSTPTHLFQPDTCFLQFTSGTTGIIKAAEISQRNIMSNLKQLNAHFAQFGEQYAFTSLVSFPFYHIFSVVFNFLFFASLGGQVLIYPDLGDMDKVLKLLRNYPVDFTVGVNTWYKKLMQHQDFPKVGWNKLKICLAGAEYVPVRTKEEWQNLTGKPLYSAYGLTETCSLSIISPFNEQDELDAIGVAIPSTEAGLLGYNNSWIQEEGVVGELLLKGNHICQRYFDNPEETGQSFHEGWFRTGDLAMYHSNNLFKIVDRKKDMIVVSGNKVYPNEVETVILELPQVKEVAVVGVSSEQTGEEVVACVVLYENTKGLSKEELVAHCLQKLSKYKIPKKVMFTGELPRTSIGKISRKDIKHQLS